MRATAIYGRNPPGCAQLAGVLHSSPLAACRIQGLRSRDDGYFCGNPPFYLLHSSPRTTACSGRAVSLPYIRIAYVVLLHKLVEIFLMTLRGDQMSCAEHHA